MTGCIEFACGLVLVLMVFADVFSTVLVPRASHPGVRFGPLLAKSLAPIWRWVSDRLPSPRLRQSARGSFGPFLLVLSLGSWIAALALGFAMMLHAQPQNLSLEKFGFAEALFQASLALSTLGMIHAEIDGSARAVVAIAGIAGFSVVSLVVAFLLSIQSALHRREVLVLTLAARAARPPTALRLLETMAGVDDEVLATFFSSWELWTADVMQSHLSYPVLCQFRSLDENMEWLACLSAVLDAAVLIAAAEPIGYQRSGRTAGFLIATAGRACHEIGRLLGVDRPTGLQEDHAHIAHQALAEFGYAMTVKEDVFYDRFERHRSTYQHGLELIAERLDIGWCDTLGG